MGERIRFGVLGTGYWAQQTHASAIAAHPGAELVAVWGRDRAKTDAMAQRFGVTGVHDLSDLLAQVDAVAIAVPPQVQPELAVAAARAGRHLLLEKPVAMGADDAERVAEAADEHGVASVVFVTARFDAARSQWLAGAVAQGGWLGAHARWLGAVNAPGSPYATSAWRQAQGAALWDVGPHALSMLLPLLGPVERVTALPGHPGGTHLVLEHEGGASSTATLSLTVPPAAATSSLDAYGDAGLSAMPDPAGSAVEAFGAALDELLARAADGGRSACDVWFGVQIGEVLGAAEESLVSGHAELV